ncbi:hypothetical protein [Rhodococcus opacus]|uniref:hypothetical protein n=1 Tax=Rhodococcus opacus TaxID=37919 RepID=UPI002953A234|nr:hypothetical protein [Rhodococcus opacus]
MLGTVGATKLPSERMTVSPSVAASAHAHTFPSGVTGDQVHRQVRVADLGDRIHIAFCETLQLGPPHSTLGVTDRVDKKFEQILMCHQKSPHIRPIPDIAHSRLPLLTTVRPDRW